MGFSCPAGELPSRLGLRRLRRLHPLLALSSRRLPSPAAACTARRRSEELRRAVARMDLQGLPGGSTVLRPRRVSPPRGLDPLMDFSFCGTSLPAADCAPPCSPGHPGSSVVARSPGIPWLPRLLRARVPARHPLVAQVAPCSRARSASPGCPGCSVRAGVPFLPWSPRGLIGRRSRPRRARTPGSPLAASGRPAPSRFPI
jgi:hypothetical protein